MTLYRVTGHQPDGTRFSSSPRTEEEAYALEKNLRAEQVVAKARRLAKKNGGPMPLRAELGLQTDIRVEPVRDAPIKRVFVGIAPRPGMVTDERYQELMAGLIAQGQRFPEFIEAQVQANKRAALAERAFPAQVAGADKGSQA